MVRQWLVQTVAPEKVETSDGVSQVRGDEPAARVGAGLHRTP